MLFNHSGDIKFDSYHKTTGVQSTSTIDQIGHFKKPMEVSPSGYENKALRSLLVHKTHKLQKQLTNSEKLKECIKAYFLGDFGKRIQSIEMELIVVVSCGRVGTTVTRNLEVV